MKGQFKVPGITVNITGNDIIIKTKDDNHNFNVIHSLFSFLASDIISSEGGKN